MDPEVLLSELYAAENLLHLSQMLRPALDPWPAHIKCVKCLSAARPSASLKSHRALFNNNSVSTLKGLYATAPRPP